MIDDLWSRFLAHRDAETKRQLIEYYLPLVRKVAARVYHRIPRYLSVDELASLGYDGLNDAIEKYDITRNVRFVSYGALRITGSILDNISTYKWKPMKAELHGFMDWTIDSYDFTNHIDSIDLFKYVIGNLDEREGFVLTCCYCNDMNLRDTGSVLGLSESMACIIRSKAIDKLRKCFRLYEFT